MVRATFSGFSTALSALQANQKRLDITGQNLANMNTVGYTRQQLDVSSLHYSNPFSHYANGAEMHVGYGVRMDGVSQVRDPYLDTQYRSQIMRSSYNDAIQVSLDTLAKSLDESKMSGLRDAFDNIQSSLTNMQDPSKVNDPVYESELRARMQTLTNLLNTTAQKISDAEQQEYERLSGNGTSEQGAVERINDILKQVGDLNVQIKRNQIYGHPSLELMDERNLLLDELASFIPIDVTYYKEPDHDNLQDWPDDLKVEMLYKNADGSTSRMILVDGTYGGKGNNYGSLEINADKKQDPVSKEEIINPRTAVITFTEARGTLPDTSTPKNIKIGADSTTASVKTGLYLESGSVQGGLDMLGKEGTGTGHDDVRGYQYYMGQLDTLAKTFADVMNSINKKYNGGELLSYADPTDPTGKNAAATIKISDGWLAGTTHVAKGKTDSSTNQTILDMLEAMRLSWPNDNQLGLNMNPKPDLGQKSFVDYMNHISVVLASDSYVNQAALTTNVTVLNGIQDARDQISGVSLDEEAANMMMYLSAYNAASRLMTTMDEALNTLINNTGLVGR